MILTAPRKCIARGGVRGRKIHTGHRRSSDIHLVVYSCQLALRMAVGRSKYLHA